MQSMPIPGYGACNPACVVGHGGPHEVGGDTVSPWVLVVGGDDDYKKAHCLKRPCPVLSVRLQIPDSL